MGYADFFVVFPCNGLTECIGKPEKLKGCESYSLRIDEFNRLVYYGDSENLEIISCKGHYED